MASRNSSSIQYDSATNLPSDGHPAAPGPISPGRMVGGIAGAFRPFATARLREESHGILARELLFAVRRRIALDEALEAFSLQDRRIPHWVGNLIALSVLLLPPLGFFLAGMMGVVGVALLLFVLLMMAAGSTQSDQYRRHVALTLCRELRRGRTLGEAMARHTELFNSFEITLIRGGERTGKLEGSLDAWARHAGASEQLGHTGDMAIYPIVVGAILAFGLSFVLLKIVPFYTQIWQTAAAAGPRSQTALGALATLGVLFGSQSFVLILFGALTLVFIVLPRRFFNGSVVGSLIYCFILFIGYQIAFWICFGVFGDFDDFDSIHPDVLIWATIPLSVLLSAGMAAVAFRLGRWLSGRGSERILALLRFLPGLRQGDRRLNESKFLFSLSTLLEGGAPWPESFEEAGRAVGRRTWEEAGRRASVQAAQGRSPAEIFRSLTTLLPETRARLTVGEFNDRLPEALGEAAVDAHRFGERLISRFNAVFFPLVHLSLGAMMCLCLALLYIPILTLPLSMPFGLD